MESLPLHDCKLHKWSAIINISQTLIHSNASMALIHYRITSFLHPTNTKPLTFFPWLLILTSELLLFFIWFLNQAYKWRPVTRTVYPERLPEDEHLPAIDVFICTADPKREPALTVMNTVLSVMALDYPQEKVSVYLSDDGGSQATLSSLREAFRFAKVWVPFCRRYGVETRCPEAYFAVEESGDDGGEVFRKERKDIEMKYKELVARLKRTGKDESTTSNGLYKPPIIEIIHDENIIDGEDPEEPKLPLLVYVSREKKPLYPHNFKAGAVNVLLRVSGVISNSPYILLLDCDMYSNDPSSARHAMCFHLDEKISPSLAFVQFPQKFHNISKNDIYDSSLKSIFVIRWQGMDGLKGPIMSGTNFYIKRRALYGTNEAKGTDLLQFKEPFGPSNEFIKSLTNSTYNHYTIENKEVLTAVQKETKLLAACTYEENTQWGKRIGFWYNCVVEDYFTGLMLHCNNWNSIFCNPTKPAFLGSATTNLNDTLVQGTRWNSGLLEVGLSKFCPLFYGLPRMTIPLTMCYGYFAFQPFYGFPVWILATIPQLCLFNNIPIYPKVSGSQFIIFLFVFISSLTSYLWEVLSNGGSLRTWWNEWRVWMIKSITAYFYGSLDGMFKLVGIKKANFTPTNKVTDDVERLKRYQMGVFDFQVSIMLLAPLVTLVILNLCCLIMGLGNMIVSRSWEEMFGQVFLSFFILTANYPIIEGMILRKDKGSIPVSITLLSLAFVMVFLSIGSVALKYV